MGSAPRRAYATTTVKVRLHQRRIRELVVTAYRERCAPAHTCYFTKSSNGACAAYVRPVTAPRAMRSCRMRLQEPAG